MLAVPESEKYGVFRMTGGDEATWAEFTHTIFVEAERHGPSPVKVAAIDRRLSDAGPPARQLAPRRSASAARLRCRAAELAPALLAVVARLLSPES
jgi:hypothetical protein